MHGDSINLLLTICHGAIIYFFQPSFVRLVPNSLATDCRIPIRLKLCLQGLAALQPTTRVYDGCGFRSYVLSPWPKRNIKTKLQINMSPAAGINTMLAAVGFRSQFLIVVPYDEHTNSFSIISSVDKVNSSLQPCTVQLDSHQLQLSLPISPKALMVERILICNNCHNS